MKRLVARMLILAIIANLPMLSHGYAATPHSHGENAAHHHDGHETDPTGHEHDHHAATDAELSSSYDEPPARPSSIPQDPDHPCCTIIGGMCVALIPEGPRVMHPQVCRDYNNAPLAASPGTLLDISPPPPKLMSSIGML